MGRVSPCVSRGGRCYGAQALRSAAFGGRVLHFPATPTTRKPQHIGGATAVLFHICGRRCGREIGGEALTLVVSEERLWNSCVGVLRTRVPEAAWQNCFGVARPIALEGSCLVLSVPSVLARQRIEGRYLDVLRATLEEVGGASYDVRLEVNPEARADTEVDDIDDLDDVEEIEDRFAPPPSAQRPPVDT